MNDFRKIADKLNNSFYDFDTQASKHGIIDISIVDLYYDPDGPTPEDLYVDLDLYIAYLKKLFSACSSRSDIAKITFQDKFYIQYTDKSIV